MRETPPLRRHSHRACPLCQADPHAAAGPAAQAGEHGRRCRTRPRRARVALPHPPWQRPRQRRARRQSTRQRPATRAGRRCRWRARGGGRAPCRAHGRTAACFWGHPTGYGWARKPGESGLCRLSGETTSNVDLVRDLDSSTVATNFKQLFELRDSGSYNLDTRERRQMTQTVVRSPSHDTRGPSGEIHDPTTRV
eukprot:scaffold59693_cov63-Phaeocystis_antarctica.AAC.1